MIGDGVRPGVAGTQQRGQALPRPVGETINRVKPVTAFIRRSGAAFCLFSE